MLTSRELDALIRPAKQTRSRLTRDRLLAAGRALLEGDAFEATLIADIAREAGCSVGAFYLRFPDKEAFFTVVIETVLNDILAAARRSAADEKFSKGSAEAMLAKCVEFWVNTCRCYQGLIRTMMKKTLHSQDAWTPVRDMGQAAVEPFIELLAARCGETDNPVFDYRARAGFQIVIGALINASLHKTALLNLDSEELVAWSHEVLRHCIFDQLPRTLLKFSTPTA